MAGMMIGNDTGSSDEVDDEVDDVDDESGGGDDDGDGGAVVQWVECRYGTVQNMAVNVADSATTVCRYVLYRMYERCYLCSQLGLELT
ncbi:hypothetical protein TWF481_005628 [Arthrobotrys musiformis]|uniref:Uncharacterized protein n=1 Tax=Arthrobotrys musiformis TaxID=47236 RepID=A0AAV9WFQ9_9PEZI